MWFSLLAVLLVAQTPGGNVPARDSLPGDAYLDGVAASLVQGARARRERVDRSIESYDVLVRERFSMGLNTPGRERLMYREETVSQVTWRRDGPGRLQMLGARSVTPVVSTELRPPTWAPIHVAFDPVDDGLVAGLGGREFMRHPLDPGSEELYRFRSGDTTGLRLPDGQTLRLIELIVQPRRSDPRLIGGSLWIDTDSYAVVQALVRPLTPYDLQAEARSGRRSGPDGPSSTAGVIEGEIHQIWVEYAWWDRQWWLPALVVYEGIGRIGDVLAVPLQVERSYEGYEVVADPVPPPPRDRFSINGPGLRRRPPFCNRGSPNCYCRGGARGRCRMIQVVRPSSAELLASEYFTGSIYDGESQIVSRGEMLAMAARLDLRAAAAWQFGNPELSWRFLRAGLTRYNRVEGLSLGGRADLDVGKAVADVTVRFGLAARHPSAELGVRFGGTTRPVRVAAYDRVAAANSSARPLSAGNSMMSLFFGRDDGEYFRARGIEMAGSSSRIRFGGLDWRLFAERQTAMERAARFSVKQWTDDEFLFRDNIAAQRADQFGFETTLRGQWGVLAKNLRVGTELNLRAATGSFDFVQPQLTLRASGALAPRLFGAVEMAGGMAGGSLPVQSLYYLGGPASLRGFGGSAASGDSFWRGRAEVGTGPPAARLAAFSDIGWAGPRAEFGRRSVRPLAGAGLGISLLDGLIRFDLSKPLRGAATNGWRADLYLDAAL